LSRRGAAAATAAERGVEDDGTRRVDGKQRENGRNRRHHHDAGYDAPRARFLQSATAKPSVAARESIFGKLLVRLFLVVGEEQRNLLVWRQFLWQHIRPLKRQRKGLLVLRLVSGLLLVLGLLLIPGLLISQLLVSISFIQPRIADGFVEPVERISRLCWQPGILRHGVDAPHYTERNDGRVPCTYFLLLSTYRSPLTDG
jgi:hypothetical protein